MKKLNWGILGTGQIAHEMADALKAMQSAEQVLKKQRNLKKK